MKRYLGAAVSAAVAIMLYIRETPPFWQMIYTLGLIAAVTLPVKESNESDHH